MIRFNKWTCLWGFALCCLSSVWAQETETPPTDTAAAAAVEETPITGGVAYEPQLDPEEETARDPFKSPFDLAKEEEERRARDAGLAVSDEDRLDYLIQSLNLKGIYLEARTGYWAIFEAGGEYKWFQVGSKFQDGDLVNITDNEVLFKQYIDDESHDLAHREIIVELHRDEE